MLSLSSTAAAIGALSRAKRIRAQAYTIHGAVLAALERAARRGARVSVRLNGTPFADPHGRLGRENERLARELEAAGASVRLAPDAHTKSIEADASTFYDDRNWGEDDVVLRAGATTARRIAVRKRDALASEAHLLRTARGDAIVETESFGGYNAVESALKRRALAGRPSRLLVSEQDLRQRPKERALLRELSRDGVRVRICAYSDKFAISAGRAWIGSANATAAFRASNLTDWGVCTSDPSIANAIRARVERHWREARPFDALARNENYKPNNA